MTSFKDESLRTVVNNQHLIKFRECVPLLSEGDEEIENIPQLALSSGSLTTKSYVRVQHVWSAPPSCFWTYRWLPSSHAYDQRLSQASYNGLMGMFGLQPDMYESVDTVLREAGARFQRLADQERAAMMRAREYRGGQDNAGVGMGQDKYRPNPYTMGNPSSSNDRMPFEPTAQTTPSFARSPPSQQIQGFPQQFLTSPTANTGFSSVHNQFAVQSSSPPRYSPPASQQVQRPHGPYTPRQNQPNPPSNQLAQQPAQSPSPEGRSFSSSSSGLDPKAESFKPAGS